jgi:PAS domain S-box-containing protein
MTLSRRPKRASDTGRSRFGWLDSVAVRLLGPGVALALLLLAVFFAQRDATSTLSSNVTAQARAEREVSRTYQSETLLLDLETGVRGFLLTHDAVFLAPWRSARTAFPASISVLVGLVAHGGAAEVGLARRIQRGGESYIRDFAAPEIAAVRADPGSASSLAAALEGKRRVDALRPLFTRLVTLTERPAAPAERRAQAAAAGASAYELAGLAAALVLILASGVYLRRKVLDPIRRVANVADARAGGDVSVRVVPSSARELSHLADSFNTMADALQDGHDRLHVQTAELRRSEAFLGSMLEHVPNLLSVKEVGELRFVSLNRAGEQMLGWSREDVIGKNADDLLLPDEADLTMRRDRATLASGVPLDIPVESIHTVDHGVRYLHTKKVPVMDEHGNPAYLLGISEDITERRLADQLVAQARDQAERANRAKSEFLSRMSHELRTPLNSILGFGHVLEMDGLSEHQREPVHYILESGRHLLGLINEVLDISLIEAGGLTIHPEPVAVRALVADVIAMVAPIARERSIRVELEPLACERHILADPQRLKQVLLNLLSNAIKYNREGGTVTVICEPARPWLRIHVRDTGFGIPDARLEEAFAPFERLGAERGRVEGTGLGLAVSRQLMKLMGGTLTVQSEPGVGSTFTAELELALESGDPAAPDEAVDGGDLVPVQPGSAVELLYIEDNVANVKLLERLLRCRPAITVTAVGQGRLGIELARHHRPEVIVLELHLPDLTGEQILVALRGDPRTAALPVIVLTADASPERAERLLDLGADAHILKPADVSSFLAAVDALLLQRPLVSP